MVRSQRPVVSLFFLCLLLITATQIFAQSPVNLGSVPVASSSGNTQTLTFTIPSGSTLGAVSVVTQGAPNLDFTATGGTCVSGSTGTCTVQVQFLPLTVGIRMGAVILTDQSMPPVTLFTTLLSGTGTGPVVTFAPGTITTFAGGTGGGSCGVGCGYGYYGGDGGPATKAGLSRAGGVAVDAAGNVYIADSMNNVVRMVNISGIITTVAGTGGRGYGGDGGPATSATLNFPATVRVDGVGNLYIADYYNNAIRMVAPNGTITTVPGTSGILSGPWGTVSDPAGNLYIGDTGNNVIRMVAPDGTVTTFAGTGSGGYSGDGGPATSAQLNGPQLGAMDMAGNLYFVDYGNDVVRVIAAGTGVISTYAGGGGVGNSGDGGPAISAQMNYPNAVAVDAAGDLYIADTGSWIGVGQGDSLVREVTPNGIMSTIAGIKSNPYLQYPGNQGYSGDGGPATAAQLYGATDVALDGTGNLYIADFYNLAIRRVDYSDGPSLSFAGSGAQDVSVVNVGNTQLTVASIVPSSNFSLGGADTTCSATNQTLDSSLSCVLGIDFLGQTGGHVSGTVVLTDDTENATAATQTITMKALPVIAWATPKAITYGTAVSATQLNAKVSYNSKSVPGTLTYLLPRFNYNGVPTVAGGTLAQGAVLGAGKQTLWVVFTPTDLTDYAPASASVILQVNQAVPKITWVKPATIPYGTPLSTSTQLDATANVPGTFTYSPAAGTILAVGSTTLNVTLTPNDVNDYETTTAKVTQVVEKATSSTSVVPSMNASIYGEQVTFTATVTPQISGTPTGTVVFKSNGVALGTETLSGGTATLVTAALAVGTDSVTVVYNGDSSFEPSTSSALSQGVIADNTTTTLTSSVNPSNYKQAVTFIATVSSEYTTVTGTVTFMNGTTALSTVNLSQGVAKYTTSALPAGANNITAVFNASTDYNGSNAGVTQTVN